MGGARVVFAAIAGTRPVPNWRSSYCVEKWRAVPGSLRLFSCCIHLQCATMVGIYLFMHRLGLLLAFTAGTLPARAQTAGLEGLVTDSTGAVLPGAKITATGPADSHGATADARGRYSLQALAPGTYLVTASAPQLATLQPVKITLKAGTQTLNLQLAVVATAEKVTVRDEGSSVTTEAASNTSAVVLQGDALEALSDDPNDLQEDLQALAGPSAGPSGGSIFIDGFSGGELPPKQSIREIRINQNPFSPEYDKLGYGRIEIFTKPGMDKYRGTVDYNFATQAWASRNPYSDTEAPFLLNELEGNAGGPLGKRASFTVDAQRNMVDNGSISNGVMLDPNLVIVPFSTIILTPGRFTRVTPRVDYQLSDRHTLTFRYGITHSDARDSGIGGFDLPSRGYHNQFTHQHVQAADTAVFGTTINETRFQFYRTASQMIANSTDSAVQVLGAFTGGGSQVGHTLDTQNNYELQNYTSMLRGAHSLKFGVRLRAQTDDNVSPQNFNGGFTFAGGMPAPVLDANNQPVLDPSGSYVMAPIAAIERYRRTLLFQQEGLAPEQIRALGGGATSSPLTRGFPNFAFTNSMPASSSAMNGAYVPISA